MEYLILMLVVCGIGEGMFTGDSHLKKTDTMQAGLTVMEANMIIMEEEMLRMDATDDAVEGNTMITPACNFIDGSAINARGYHAEAYGLQIPVVSHEECKRKCFEKREEHIEINGVTVYSDSPSECFCLKNGVSTTPSETEKSCLFFQPAPQCQLKPGYGLTSDGTRANTVQPNSDYVVSNHEECKIRCWVMKQTEPEHSDINGVTVWSGNVNSCYCVKNIFHRDTENFIQSCIFGRTELSSEIEEELREMIGLETNEISNYH